jgi:heat-inducible transcriptional repressor
MTISERQEAILRAVVEEFMKSAEAVGSSRIVKQYDVDVSPATVRNDMVDLAEKGYLAKSHLSSGRVPTDLGLRYFVKEMMEEERLKNLDEVNVRIKVYKNRFEEEKLMSQVLDFLSDETGYAAVSLVDDTLRYRGMSSLLDYDELRDVDVLEMILRLLESSSLLQNVFTRYGSENVSVLIGQECDLQGLRHCSVVFSRFNYYGGRNGYLGVLGPRRMRYSRVIPSVKAVRGMLEEAVRGW